MAIDPISAGLAGAGLLMNLLQRGDQQKAAAQAGRNQATNVGFQNQNLLNALMEARLGRTDRENQARLGAADLRSVAQGGRTDRFGNRVVYDPTTREWRTDYTPLQRELIGRGQERQRLAGVRGAQASEDYQRQRAGYLYDTPPSEEATRAEILNLINQAMGTGEQQINTIMNRFNTRTAGNIPVLRQSDRGPSRGQELAETMLKAREAALNETLTRQKGHASQYLPAMEQFERTANFVPGLDPTGAEAQGMQDTARSELFKAIIQGNADLLGGSDEYNKLIASIYGTGGQNINTAYSGVEKANAQGIKAAEPIPLNQISSLIASMQAKPEGKLTNVGSATTGSSTGGTGGSSLGGHDRRFNYGPESYKTGTGTEAAPFGGASYGAWQAASEATNPFEGFDAMWATPKQDPKITATSFKKYVPWTQF